MQDVSKEGVEVLIYPKDELKAIGMVEITKSLTADDVGYLLREVERINRDLDRLAVIGYNRGSYVLFVNDVTEGAFDKLGEDIGAD